MSTDPFHSLFPPSALRGVLPEAQPSPPPMERKIWTVSGIIRQVQDALEAAFPPVWVEGEISNLREPSSGHVYFTLKEDQAQIRAVMFRLQAERLPFRLAESQHVVCLGRLNIYAGRGDLQLVVDTVEPKGTGALRLAFEQLRARLEAEGLFDEARKRPLPVIPRRLFVVTSPTGAAIRDFIRTARLRYPGAQIVLCPVKVQGDEAAPEMIEALKAANQAGGEGDVILLTRGGGSIEDLWAFNNEALARAIFTSSLPVVSAVGHETDYSISDLVADLRAATPTAAAQSLLPDHGELARRLDATRRGLETAIRNRLRALGQEVDLLRLRLADPRRRLVEQRLLHDDLLARLRSAMALRLDERRRRLHALGQRLNSGEVQGRLGRAHGVLDALSGRLLRTGGLMVEQRRLQLAAQCAALEAVSPLAVLGRGYSLVRRFPDGQIVASAEAVTKGEKITVLPAKGAILCEVLATGDRPEDFGTQKK